MRNISFDPSYPLLKEMVQDEYYPPFLVEKIKNLIQNLIVFLESGTKDIPQIQDALDQMTLAINDLQEEFDENGSEIETVARDSIAATILYILDWFDITIDIEDALGARDW